MRLVPPPRGASVRGGLQTEGACSREASAEVPRCAAGLLASGSRRARWHSPRPTPARDLVRLAEREAIDLLLLDGRRPLLGGGVPRGEVGAVLERAPCDVAVLVAREDAGRARARWRRWSCRSAAHEHDWAALELGAWLSSATGAPLRLLGAAGQTDGGRDASRLLASASLLVQRFVGVPAEPVVAEPGRDGDRRGRGGSGAARRGPVGALAPGGPRAMRAELASRRPRRSCSSAAACAPVRSRRATTSPASRGHRRTSGTSATPARDRGGGGERALGGRVAAPARRARGRAATDRARPGAGADAPGAEIVGAGTTATARRWRARSTGIESSALGGRAPRRVSLHRTAVAAAARGRAWGGSSTRRSSARRPDMRLHVRPRPFPHRGAHQAPQGSATRSCATRCTSSTCRSSPPSRA